MRRSGDLEKELTAETRRRGENQKPTTEARRHGEESGDRVIDVVADSDQDVMVEHTIDLCHPERAGAHATASRRIPTTPFPKHAASGSSYEILKDLLAQLTSALQTLCATVREIFDESAYERFLLRTNEGRSIASYRNFMRERDSAMLKKPRCC
jgi:hypothetical protein